MSYSTQNRTGKGSLVILVLLFIAGLIVGGMVTAYFTLQQIGGLRNQVAGLESRISETAGFQNITYQNITVYQNTTTLSLIYETVKDSVVFIRNTMSNGTVAEGSGFVYNFTGGGISVVVVVTNNHVVAGASSLSVTFSDGNGYAASINGTDNYSDLAVLIVDAPESEFTPLSITSSSTLRVGNPVIAIGNPFGLVGSMTTGIVSALGRTINEGTQGGFAIANIIQTSAPINPGNSGGPLLNYMGEVVGITTAIIQDSQGLGFAIPSNSILREVYSLVTTGGYSGHSYLGVSGSDMDYETAQEMHVNVTYGWLIASVVSGGPSADAGVHARDIIVGMNGTDIRNGDELSSYLEEHTFPADVLVLKIVRGSDILDIPVILDRRP